MQANEASEVQADRDVAEVTLTIGGEQVTLKSVSYSGVYRFEIENNARNRRALLRLLEQQRISHHRDTRAAIEQAISLIKDKQHSAHHLAVYATTDEPNRQPINNYVARGLHLRVERLEDADQGFRIGPIERLLIHRPAPHPALSR
jgi:hypothetical protein